MPSPTDQVKNDHFKKVVSVFFLIGFFIFIIQMGMLISKIDGLKPNQTTKTAGTIQTGNDVELSKEIAKITQELKNIDSSLINIKNGTKVEVRDDSIYGFKAKMVTSPY